MRTRADEEALRERLLEIADDHNRLPFTRHLANSAVRDLSDFPEVPDLTDETLLEALRQRVQARADRLTRPDDPEELRRRLGDES